MIMLLSVFESDENCASDFISKFDREMKECQTGHLLNENQSKTFHIYIPSP